MAVLKNGLRVQCASKSEGQFIAEEIFEEGVYCSHGVTVGAVLCALLLCRPFSRFLRSFHRERWCSTSVQMSVCLR